jgi:hypothetical protein
MSQRGSKRDEQDFHSTKSFKINAAGGRPSEKMQFKKQDQFPDRRKLIKRNKASN